MKIISMKYKDRKYVVYEYRQQIHRGQIQRQKIKENSQVATTIRINILGGEPN